MQRKVAFLLDYASRSWGTRDDMLAALCHSLATRGVTPVVVTSESPPALSAGRYRAAGADLATMNYANGLTAYARGLRRLVHIHRVDTVHMRFFNHFTALPWLSRLLGVPHVILTDAEGGELTEVPWKRALLGWRTRIATQPIGRMIAISQFVKHRLVRLGVHEDRIAVVHNGVDAKHYRPDGDMREAWARRHSVAPGEIILATASPLVAIKHVSNILESVVLLTGAGVGARLFVAGDGPLRRELEETSRRLGISERTHWLGHVDPRPLMQACDIFVLASVGEAFGNVLIEAMACGAPVAATRSGGIPEVVAEGETGLLAPPGTPSALAETIQMLVAKPELRQRMGRLGRKRVEHEFTLERFTAETIQVYDSLWRDEGNRQVAHARRLPLA